jgi:uncharacterized delta-60 repeat protein
MTSVLDTTFGTTGIVNDTYMASNQFSSVHALAIDSQKRIVITGYSDNNYQSISLARYLPNGQLDTTFGTGGKVTFSGIALKTTRSIAIDSLNNIVVGGNSDASINRYCIAKVLANGQLDTSFGTGGIILDSNPAFTNTYLTQLKIDSSDRIVMCGKHNGFLVVRYLSNGQLDSTFGTGGIVSSQIFGYINSILYALAFDNLGRIVVGGEAQYARSYGIARLLSDGSLDSTFGTSGVVITNSTPVNRVSRIYSIAIDSSNRVIAGGFTHQSYLLLRLLENGQYDSSFGTGGTVISQFPYMGTISIINSIALDALNNIICVGEHNNSSGCVALYTSSGQLDTTFGTGGIVQYSVESRGFFAVAFDNLDRAVVGGYSKGNAYFLGRILTPYSVTESPSLTVSTPASKKSLFSNNSLVFYKPGTFGGGDTGSTTNSRVKSRRC